MADMQVAEKSVESEEQKIIKTSRVRQTQVATKIYTKAGDLGFTTLLGSSMRVPKWDSRVEAYGSVDELNAHLGLVLEALTELPRFEHDSQTSKDILGLRATLVVDVTTIQRSLFVMSSWLSLFSYHGDNKYKLSALERASVTELETRIDQMTSRLPVLKNFILQQGEGTSFIHVARTVCRRAECNVAKAIYEHSADEIEQYVIILEYMNRLSDWLYTVARYYTFVSGQREIRV
jgi:cob(I)alamin adenosyltransferase